MNGFRRQLGAYRAAWEEALRDRGFRRELTLTLLAIAAGLVFFGRFVGWVENREGVSFSDPLLRLFPAVDVSALTFGVIYSAILLALVALARSPVVLTRAGQAYVLMVAFRTVAMYLMPLDPPTTMLALRDPIVGSVAAIDLPTKDLFFSGHTSTMFLLALTARDRRLRWVFLLATVLVAACVLIQHVHYTIDVFVAPFVAYASWQIVAAWYGERPGAGASAKDAAE